MRHFMGVRGVRGLWNCVAMEQSGYIREWQNLLLTLSSLYDSFLQKLHKMIPISLIFLYNNNKV